MHYFTTKPSIFCRTHIETPKEANWARAILGHLVPHRVTDVFAGVAAQLECGICRRSQLVMTVSHEVGMLQGFFHVHTDEGHVLFAQLSRLTPLGDDLWDSRSPMEIVIDSDTILDSVAFIHTERAHVLRILAPPALNVERNRLVV